MIPHLRRCVELRSPDGTKVKSEEKFHPVSQSVNNLECYISDVDLSCRRAVSGVTSGSSDMTSVYRLTL
jgi:hypothetical protein